MCECVCVCVQPKKRSEEECWGLQKKVEKENVRHRVNEDKSETWSNTVPEMCAFCVTGIFMRFFALSPSLSLTLSHSLSHSINERRETKKKKIRPPNLVQQDEKRNAASKKRPAASVRIVD